MRKILLAFLILPLILGITATGAFTSVSADRVAKITVADDTNALLALTPYNGPNGAYFVDTNNDGAYELRVGNAATGLNVDSTIIIENIFTITNNGTQTVTVTLTDIGAYNDRTDFGAVENGVSLGVGQSVVVSLRINTNGLKEGTDLLDSILIKAEK